MLEELPESLDETYERVLRDINKANRAHAHRLLQCLTVAIRPLHVAELAEVLAIDLEAAPGEETSTLKTDWRWEDQEQAVLSTCSSLVAVVNENGSQVVQFSHFSVKEFLTSPRLAASTSDVSRFHILLEPAHTIMARACLGTLLRLDNTSDQYNVKDQFPLARYAAEHWVIHAQFEDVSSHMQEAMEILFDPDKPYFSAWIRIYDIDVMPNDSLTLWYFPTKIADTAPLYYAAFCGFHSLVGHLINRCPQGVNVIGGFYVSPLVAALAMEHFEVSELLYLNGAHVDVQGYNECTPLYDASSKGHLEFVQWLLRHGADPSTRDKFAGWTALHAATSRSHLEVTRILLQHNADPNIQDDDGNTPLHVASQFGSTTITRLLLEQGADVNAQSKDGSTPLHFASKDGRLEVERVLIEYGADRDKDYSSK